MSIIPNSCSLFSLTRKPVALPDAFAPKPNTLCAKDKKRLGPTYLVDPNLCLYVMSFLSDGTYLSVSLPVGV